MFGLRTSRSGPAFAELDQMRLAQRPLPSDSGPSLGVGPGDITWGGLPARWPAACCEPDQLVPGSYPGEFQRPPLCGSRKWRLRHVGPSREEAGRRASGVVLMAKNIIKAVTTSQMRIPAADANKSAVASTPLRTLPRIRNRGRCTVTPKRHGRTLRTAGLKCNACTNPCPRPIP